MTGTPRHLPAHPTPPSFQAGRRARAAIGGVVLALLLSATSAVPGPSVHTYVLQPDLVAQVRDDGGLWIGSAGGDAPLLEAVLLAGSPRRARGRDLRPFEAAAHDGMAGGHRGFSAQRDDDGDGLVDEDPLDGRDNDGDGRIDEDFAAISDDMVVFGDGQGGHLEYYHWNAAHLGPLVFLKAEASGRTYRLVLQDAEWREEIVAHRGHDLAGNPRTRRTTAFVGRDARTDCDPAGTPWFGVVMLESDRTSRVVLDGGSLEIHLGEAPVPVAVAVAQSRLQLDRLLNEAVRVRRGVVDKVTGERAPWIAPALCARCRLAAAPDFTWSRDARHRLVLAARIGPGTPAAVDPDLFRLGTVSLGSPTEIRWIPDHGRSETLAWGCGERQAEAGPWSALDAAFGHGASGELEFVFAEPERDEQLVPGATVEGVYHDGRPFRARLQAMPVVAATESPRGATRPEPAAIPGAEEQARVLKSTERAPVLSPTLLEGFPNPFRETIQLRFQVPATMGEAFVWDPNEDPPAGLDFSAAIPWQGGQPQVSVKIYSINGQELVTLFSGSMGAGENTVRWSGTDSYGRQVSSGTYFCKLQMDDWSVTRRLVFLR